MPIRYVDVGTNSLNDPQDTKSGSYESDHASAGWWISTYWALNYGNVCVYVNLLSSSGQTVSSIKNLQKL